jgi:hypothetical protein
LLAPRRTPTTIHDHQRERTEIRSEGEAARGDDYDEANATGRRNDACKTRQGQRTDEHASE